MNIAFLMSLVVGGTLIVAAAAWVFGVRRPAQRLRLQVIERLRSGAPTPTRGGDPPPPSQQQPKPVRRGALPNSRRDTAQGRPLRRLLGETRGLRRHLVGVLGLELLATPLVLITPIPLKITVDSVLGHKPLPDWIKAIPPGWAQRTDVRLLAAMALAQVLLVLLAQFRNMAGGVLQTFSGEKLTLRFRARLFRHAQRLSLSYHDTRGIADSLYRIQADAPAIQWITVYGLIGLLSSLVALVSVVVVTAALDWQLAIVASGVIPPLYALTRVYNRRLRPRYREVKGLESSALHIVHEVLGAFRVVKAFGREDAEQDRFVVKAAEGLRARVRLSVAEGLYGVLVNGTTALGAAVVLFVGVRNVQSGKLTLGELLMVMAYLAQLYAPLTTISRQVADMQSSLASAERAFELLDQPGEVPERRDARPFVRARGAIEFRGVSFAYDPSHPVLANVAFAVEPGTRLGIEGRTGAGKSTIVNLLMRFYDPSAGEILVDGVNVREYRLADLRSQFALVLQDPVLFSTSIGENILYARPDSSVDEVIAAAELADAHRFITALPDGYGTPVGERGMRLSGGERQRISLARAFLRDAPILVLDEPTSSVDVLTETSIMDALERLMGGRTTLMIAHRLSTLDRCDARIVIVDGRVANASGSVNAATRSPMRGAALTRQLGFDRLEREL